tara:strand:- start:2011 stop:2196 length:186 start_codon:yes stop_codon:yes gene_type:complete
MFALLLQAISLASRPDSTKVLTEAHLKPPKRKRVQKIKSPIKKTRQWKGVYEHKDTPIHHH